MSDDNEESEKAIDEAIEATRAQVSDIPKPRGRGRHQSYPDGVELLRFRADESRAFIGYLVETNALFSFAMPTTAWIATAPSSLEAYVRFHLAPSFDALVELVACRLAEQREMEKATRK